MTEQSTDYDSPWKDNTTANLPNGCIHIITACLTVIKSA